MTAPNPPVVEACSVCNGSGAWCSGACHGVGRIVWGGTLPTLSHVADRLRELVREDIGFPVAQQALDAAWHDELAVFAEACERFAGERAALQERAETAERALRIAEASARLNAETSRQQSIEWREANALLHAEIRRLQRQLRGEAVGA